MMYSNEAERANWEIKHLWWFQIIGLHDLYKNISALTRNDWILAEIPNRLSGAFPTLDILDKFRNI